jgi:acylphosphatase
MCVHYAGSVQGVGFRYTVKSLAPGYELTGVVRNLADGRVELLVEGDRAELAAFRQAIGQSGLGSLIRNEAVSWGVASGEFRGFAIVG